MAGLAVFLLIALWILVPVLETDKDEPGVYRISADKTHEVVYLTHHYAIHRSRGEDFCIEREVNCLANIEFGTNPSSPE